MERKFGALNAKDIAKLAKERGFSVVSGNGRHGLHLVARTGERRPLPSHGNRNGLANGTRNHLIRFILIYGNEEQAA